MTCLLCQLLIGSCAESLTAIDVLGDVGIQHLPGISLRLGNDLPDVFTIFHDVHGFCRLNIRSTLLHDAVLEFNFAEVLSRVFSFVGNIGLDGTLSRRTLSRRTLSRPNLSRPTLSA